MAFRFKLNEPIVRGVRRIAVQQVDRAAAHIQASAGAEAVTSVHEARKCLKRTRALLRFVKPLISRDDFKSLNGTLRDVGKAMSATRDRDVVHAAALKLAGDSALKPATAKRLKAIHEEASAPAEPPSPAAEPGALVAALVAFKATVAEIGIDHSGHHLPTAGLAESMVGLRRDFVRAYEASDGEAFHEWRKSVQLHWRHMQLVVNAWPDLCRARIEEARAISHLIGDDRDLALLMAHLGQYPLPKAMQAEVAAHVATRQAALRLQAKARADRLLEEGTQGFCRRLETYWSAARRLKAAQPEEAAAEPAA